MVVHLGRRHGPAAPPDAPLGRPLRPDRALSRRHDPGDDRAQPGLPAPALGRRHRPRAPAGGTVSQGLHCARRRVSPRTAGPSSHWAVSYDDAEPAIEVVLRALGSDRRRARRRRRIFGKWGRPQEFRVSPDGKTLARRSPTGKSRIAATAGTNAEPGAASGPRSTRSGSWTSPPAVTWPCCAFEWSPLPIDGLLARRPIPRGRPCDGTVRIYDASTGRERLPRFGAGVGRSAGPHRARRRSLGHGSRVDRPPGVLAGWLDPRRGLEPKSAVTPSPGALYLWDFASGRELRRIGGFRVGPASLSFAPDGKTIATAGSWEPMPRIWDVATGREAFPQPGHVMGISALAVSPADGTVFTGSYDGTVRQLGPGHRARAGADRPVQLRPRRWPSLPTARPSSWADSSASRCSGACRSAARSAASGVRREGHRPTRSRYSPDGRTVAFDAEDLGCRLGPTRSTCCAPATSGTGTPTAVDVLYLRREASSSPRSAGSSAPGTSRRERRLVPALRSDRFLAIDSRRRLVPMAGSWRPAVCPDAGGDAPPQDPWIRVWELATGREIAKLPTHENSVSGVALSPDGRLLASFRPNQPGDQQRLRATTAGPDDPDLGRGHRPRAAPARGAPWASQRGRLHARRPLR